MAKADNYVDIYIAVGKEKNQSQENDVAEIINKLFCPSPKHAQKFFNRWQEYYDKDLWQNLKG